MGQAHYQRDGDPRTSGPGFGLTCHPDALDAPLHWKAPRRVFVNSMSDLFHRDVPAHFRLDVWQVMAATRRHTYQILTKRAPAMAEFARRLSWYVPPDTNVATGEPYLSSVDPITVEGWPHGTDWDNYIEDPLPNVWVGVSIENQRYTFRARHLRQTPAAVRFLSCEPLLGPLSGLDLTGIHWVIIGAESGPGARPMELDWARAIVAKCRADFVPVFVKQLSGPGGRAIHDLERFPKDLQIREYPR